MRKLSLVGHDATELIDCSDVIPDSRSTWANKERRGWSDGGDSPSDEPDPGPHLPAGKSMDDIEQTVSATCNNLAPVLIRVCCSARSFSRYLR